MYAGSRTFYISMTHCFSVLLDCNLQVFLCFHLNKGLTAGATLTGVSEVNAATIVDNLAVCGGKYPMRTFMFFSIYWRVLFSKEIDEWTHT